VIAEITCFTVLCVAFLIPLLLRIISPPKSVDEAKLADAPVLKRAFTDRISLAAAVIQSMKPNVNKALGPYCTFDPVTGIGMAGDWFVEVHMHAKMSSCGTGLTPTSMRVDLHMNILQVHHQSKPTHMIA
jgi:hypothetical protein